MALRLRPLLLLCRPGLDKTYFSRTKSCLLLSRASFPPLQICAVQMGKGLSGVSAEQMENVVIAYEPVGDFFATVCSVERSRFSFRGKSVW